MTINPEHLEVGKWYVVDADDCCVSIQFTDRLVAKIFGEEDDLNTLEFERVTQTWPFYSSTYKEVPESNSTSCSSCGADFWGAD